MWEALVELVGQIAKYNERKRERQRNQSNYENQTQIRVEDARKAGIHPLAALGQATVSPGFYGSGEIDARGIADILGRKGDQSTAEQKEIKRYEGLERRYNNNILQQTSEIHFQHRLQEEMKTEIMKRELLGGKKGSTREYPKQGYQHHRISTSAGDFTVKALSNDLAEAIDNPLAQKMFWLLNADEHIIRRLQSGGNEK